MNRQTFNRIFFTNKELYKQTDNDTKTENYFMFNRCMARLSPLNADSLNHINIDSSCGMDVWSIFAQKLLKEPNGFEPEWWKYGKSKTESVFDGFEPKEKELLSTYYKESVSESVKDIEQRKNMGTIEENKL